MEALAIFKEGNDSCLERIIRKGKKRLGTTLVVPPVVNSGSTLEDSSAVDFAPVSHPNDQNNQFRILNIGDDAVIAHSKFPIIAER
jgi:hypothetical protein